ncbi:MAG: hypothetical protein P1U58_20805, partial [Verrucomicrobiales bacterium]|nr:hypothetical protein [Verrucomicrobiales bacterium]
GEEIETLPYLLTEMSLRHGTLHSWSNRNDDLAVDVTAAEDRDDFVQVYTFLGGWIALTADGTAISSDPQYNRTRIARICGGLHTSFGLIDFDGNLEAITIDAAKPEEPLNEVVDAFVSETHSIALFENGRIHTWGPAYRGETPDRLIWEPAPRTLRRIKKIIGSTVVGAAVSEEGELTAWTHAGEGQFGETVNQEIRDVTARPTGLRVINREGHFYWWNAEGNGYRKRTDLAEELGPISEIFDNSGNCNLIRLEQSNEVTTDSGAAKSAGIEKSLTPLEGLPDYAFSLYDDVGIYRLLWIEYED